jgi:hypothetical protein
MNTERLMEIALDMAGLSEIPGDSAVHHAGRGIRRLLVGIDPRVDRLRDEGLDVTTASGVLPDRRETR